MDRTKIGCTFGLKLTLLNCISVCSNKRYYIEIDYKDEFGCIELDYMLI